VIGKKLRLFFVLGVWILISIWDVAHTGPYASREYLVKAAFVYNFARFVEWPSEAFADHQGPITLAILGKDPFGDTLEAISGKPVKGRKLEIRRVDRIEDLERCHMLFVSGSEKENLSQIFVKVSPWPVLTVSDMEGFAQRGGIINFIKVEKKIRFEINVDAAERTSLNISSKLLKLAKIVEDKQNGAEH
jgi:hypothetical protein